MPALRIRGLSLFYEGKPVFEGLDLDVDGFVVLLGASGVGKTSLLRVVAGLDRADAGTVVAGDGAPLAGRVAYMGQQDLLLPWLDAVGNVMLGARLRGERPDRAERVGLRGRARAMPAQLSGGMRQRVALARTLYEDRPVVLMDEPFAALDTVTRARVQDMAAELLRGRTVLLITHDPAEACRLADRLVVMAGSPARLGAPIPVPGAAPRAPDDPAVLEVQGRLLRALTA
jgi:putative hydroxymethylpyrimidine transport system ATP-binding protein